MGAPTFFPTFPGIHPPRSRDWWILGIPCFLIAHYTCFGSISANVHHATSAEIESIPFPPMSSIRHWRISGPVPGGITLSFPPMSSFGHRRNSSVSFFAYVFFSTLAEIASISRRYDRPDMCRSEVDCFPDVSESTWFLILSVDDFFI